MKLRNFFNNLMDKFLEAMKLTDDEPDLMIESTTEYITMGKYTESLLRLAVRTDLSLYAKAERQNYCLRLQPNDDRTRSNSYLLCCVDGSTTDELDKLRDYLTSEKPFLGLVGIIIYYDKTILKFITIDNPQVEYAYCLDHHHEFSIAIEKPLETDNLYDSRFGAYNQLQLAIFCHPIPSVVLQRSLDSEVVFREIARPYDIDGCQSSADAASPTKEDCAESPYFLIDTIHHDWSF